MTSGPNFIIAGAARSGTTALARFLGEHPDILIPDKKEPHFLAMAGRPLNFTGPGDDRMMNTVAVTELEEWQALYTGPESIKGDCSVSTLYYYDRTIPAIGKYVPVDAKIFVMLRNPVDRAYSSYMYMVSRGYEELSFEDALAAEPGRIADGWHHIWHYRAMSNYGPQLQAFADAFGDRLTVLLHDDFEKDPASVFNGILDDLGLSHCDDIDVHREVNRGGVPQNRWLNTAMLQIRKIPPLKNALKAIVGEQRRERIRAGNLDRPDMLPDTRTLLEAEYAATIDEVEAIGGISLAAWRPSQV